MGGVGYMDEPDEPEYNISRLYRDTAANMTWEGTTNVLGSEVTRHLMNGNNLSILGEWFVRSISSISDQGLAERLNVAWVAFHSHLEAERHDMGVLLAGK